MKYGVVSLQLPVKYPPTSGLSDWLNWDPHMAYIELLLSDSKWYAENYGEPFVISKSLSQNFKKMGMKSREMKRAN